MGPAPARFPRAASPGGDSVSHHAAPRRRRLAAILSKCLRHDLRRTHAPLILEDDLDGLLRIVSNRYQVQIARADKLVTVLKLALHPLKQSGPIPPAEQN